MSRKKKIIYCITGLNKGGAEKIFTRLISSPLLTKKYKPVVISFLGGYYEPVLKQNDIKAFIIIKNKSKLLSIIAELKKILSYLIRNKKDIHIMHSFLPHGGLIAAIVKLIVNKPIFHSVRCTPSKFMKIRLNFIRWLAHNIIMRMANIISCTSSFILNELPKNKKTLVIENGIDIPKFSIDFSKKELFDPAFNFYSVTVCNMRPEKDIPSILKVAKQLPEIQFIFVGGGSSLETFKNIAIQSELSNTLFVGQQEDINSFLYFADIYLLLTKHEGFPNTVLEAMANKKPVIASNIPQLYDVLTNNHNCLLVENYNIKAICKAIIFLKNNTDKRKLLALTAYNEVKEKFTYDKMVKKNISVYDSL